MHLLVSRKSVIVPLSFLLPFCFYFFTMCRGIPIGDSAELALAATNLEIAHPPGYPLLTLVGHLWTVLIFFARPIVALNFFVVVTSSIAAACFFLLLRSLSKTECIASDFLALAVSLAFAFSRTFWSISTNYEVHALSAMLMVLILFCVYRFLTFEQPRWLILASYMFGLALCNHLSVLALAPLLLIPIIWKWQLPRIRVLALAAAFGVLPLSIYAYMLVRSHFDLVLAWYNPRTWTGFKQQVFAETYQNFVASPTTFDIVPYFYRIGNQFGSELLVPVLLIAILGMFIQWGRNRIFSIMLFSVAISNILLNLSYTISDIGPYFLPTIIVGMIWMFELLNWISSKSRALSIAAVAVAVLVASVAAIGNYQRSDLSDRTEVELYAQDLFARTPGNGLLLCGSDNSMFPTLYLRYAENYRPDCVVSGHLPTLNHLQRQLGLSSNREWTHFPDLLKHAIESRNRPVVMVRELMNFDNNFPRIVDGLIAHDLVYTADTSLRIAHERFKFDYRKMPEIYDPKEAMLYSLYLLVAGEEAKSQSDLDADRHFARARQLVNTMNEPSLASALAAYFADAGQYRHAIEVIEPTLELTTLRKSERLQLLGGLAKLQSSTSNAESAKQTLNEMLKLDRGNIEAKFQLMAMDVKEAIDNNRIREAIDTLVEMRNLAPDQHQVSMQLALLYIRNGENDLAQTALERCIQADYRAEDARALLREMESGDR